THKCSKKPTNCLLTSSSYSSSSSNKSLNYLLRGDHNVQFKSDSNKESLDIFTKKSFLKIKHGEGNFYHEKVVLGYSRQQMCDLVFDVDKYYQFVPFCIHSYVIKDTK